MAGSDDDRTNPVGLFNTARSYWRSAEHLNSTRLEVTHPQSPVTFLFCHAIELYLKAYLRGTGKDVGQLKQLGHHVANLAQSAIKSGLAIGPEHSEILNHIDDADVAIEARYIVTGFKNVPTNEALSNVAMTLDKTICSALARQGLAVRTEEFKPAALQQQNDLSEDALRVLVYMFRMEIYHGREIKAMAQGLEMGKNTLQYHLDCLDHAGLAEMTGGNYVGGNVYWDLTAEGRRHVVERKLA
jgi:DNA-binding MarR family transcriptional regulator